MWTCPICLNKEENKDKCSECGFDHRTDYLENRTLCAVSEEDIADRNRINERFKFKDLFLSLLVEHTDLNTEYESSKKQIDNLKKEIDNLQKEIDTLKDKPTSQKNETIKTKETYSDGGWYEGDLKNGVRYGKGTFYYSNGDRYEGDWEKGSYKG